MMRQARAWALRVAGMATRSRKQREFDAELQSHLEMHVDDNIRGGMTPDQARREALIALGGMTTAREAYRDRLGIPSLDALTQDVRFGWRMLRRAPGISMFAVVAVALGIGINTMVFSLVNGVLYKHLPGADADRLVFVGTLNASRDDVDGVSAPDFYDTAARVRSLSGLAASASTAADFNDAKGYAESLQGEQVTANAFAVAGLRILAGRAFLESDAQPGAPPVAILSARIWKTRYSNDPSVIGTTIRLNGIPTTLIGVVEQAPLINEGHTGIWTPFLSERHWNDRTWRRLLVFGRLAPGETVGSANAEISAIGGALAREFPDTNRDAPLVARDFRAFSLPAKVRLLFLVMLGAVGFVLLVACANVANLLLARAAGRTREVAIRAAIGASRARSVRQLLVESLMLSMLGALLGFAIAVCGVRAFDAALVDVGRPLWLSFSVDFTVLAYLAAVTVATAVLFGLAPAWLLSRIDAHSTMKEGTPGAGRRRSRRVMACLVVTEMALAVILLAGAGVMIRSFLNVHRAPLGFDRSDLHTLRLNTAFYYDAPDERARVFRDLVGRIQAIPGVNTVAMTSRLPFGNRSYDVPVEFADGSTHGLELTSVISVMGPYDRGVGAPVRDGRFLTVAESIATPSAAVINASFAARAWPGQSALGKQFRLVIRKKPQAWLTIIGVMPDVAQRERDLHRPVAYVPYSQVPETDIGFVVRSGIAPESLFQDIRTAVRSINADLPVLDLDTFENQFYVNHWPERVFGALFTAFGAIALLLASIGLYGVTSYSAAQRSHEIGVRVALGATARNVMTDIASGSAKQLAIALTLGLGGAAVLTRLLSAQLVGVSPNDPATFASVAVVLTVTAMAGCILPVRRALRVSPVEALRHE
jgi:predicted permease